MLEYARDQFLNLVIEEFLKKIKRKEKKRK